MIDITVTTTANFKGTESGLSALRSSHTLHIVRIRKDVTKNSRANDWVSVNDDIGTVVQTPVPFSDDTSHKSQGVTTCKIYKL